MGYMVPGEIAHPNFVTANFSLEPVMNQGALLIPDPCSLFCRSLRTPGAQSFQYDFQNQSRPKEPSPAHEPAP